MAENKGKQRSTAAKSPPVDIPHSLSEDVFTKPPSKDEEISDLKKLALQAKDLSKILHTLRSDCGHESTSADIASVSQELQRLSTELESLDVHVKGNAEYYTPTFGEDLAELRAHMASIFEDVADCCEEMRKADGPNTSTVSWLHKKRYVRKLQKHLEANKTSLVVMRTVLHHGKEYGTDTSSEHFLAEKNPHILNEDYAILLTVHATRNAWKDLQEDASKSHEHNSSTSSAATGDIPTFVPGPHGRNLSAATGVETLDVPDVLPVVAPCEKKRSRDKDDLARKLSRRGVRLAVHSSILDLDAHRVPLELRKRWMQQAVRQHDVGQGTSHAWPSIAALSKISEGNSSSGGDDQPIRPDAVDRSSCAPRESSQSDPNGVKDLARPSSRHKLRHRSLALISSSMGRTLGRVISRLSNTRAEEGKAAGKKKSTEEASPELSKGSKPRTERKVRAGNPEKAGTGWSYRLTRPFIQSELTLSDLEKDVENMALR